MFSLVYGYPIRARCIQEGAPILKNSGLKTKKLQKHENAKVWFVRWPRIGCSACFDAFVLFCLLLFLSYY